MNRVGVLLIAMSAFAISACDSRKVEKPQAESQAGGAADEVVANESEIRRVHESDCLEELLPSLALGSDVSVTMSGDTAAGCEFSGTVVRAPEELASTLSSALSRKGYSLEDSVGAKGGTRLTYSASDGLAISALVKGIAAGEGSGTGISSSRLDLHWYDPERLAD